MHVPQVLWQLQEYGVYAKLEKCSFFFFLKKVHLGINRKMPKGYNKFIQYIITLISTSTRMSSIRSPHESCSKTGGGKSHLGGAYLHFILSPKEMKTSTFFQISLNCCCLRIKTSGSPIIASYWPLKVCTSINHTSLTKSTAFCLTIVTITQY